MSAPDPRCHVATSAAIREAGNGSATNGSSDTPARPRKRLRKPETWKKNVAKVKRARGEAYVSPCSGREIEARKTGPPCQCKRHCFDQFTVEERESIINDFYALGDKQLQDAHLFGLISSHEVKRKRPRRRSVSARKKARKASYTYRVSQC